MAVSLLEQLGYHTIAVEDAEAALDALAAGHQINLLFSDVVLPGRTDGVALAREVAERYPKIPIVLTTGYSKVFESEPEFPGAAQTLSIVRARPRHPRGAQFVQGAAGHAGKLRRRRLTAPVDAGSAPPA